MSSVLFAFALGAAFGAVLLAYVVLTGCYSVALKHLAILDVIVIASGFTLRAMAGAIVIDVPISEWLYVVTSFGALFLATLRRRQEWLLVRDAGLAARAAIGQYSGEFLEQVTSLAMTSTVISYAMYVTTARNLPPDHSMLITLPCVVYGLLRFRLIADRWPERNIDEMLVRDRLSLINIVAFGGSALTILLMHRVA
jgi:4-hydroxybenzoate polyprenyltransferase